MKEISTQLKIQLLSILFIRKYILSEKRFIIQRAKRASIFCTDGEMDVSHREQTKTQAKKIKKYINGEEKILKI